MARNEQEIIKSPNPVAPLSEIRARGLNPATTASCGKRELGEGKVGVIVLGCKNHDKCTFPFKDTAGPKYGGVRVIPDPNSGGTMKEMVLPCHDYIQMKDEHEVGGGIMEWIAEEGEEIVVRGSRKADPLLPNSPFVDFVERQKVPVHKHIDGDVKMVDQVLEAEIRKVHKERSEQARRVEMMGMELAGNPTDDDAGKPKRR